jgi:hypothetical protein
MEGEKMTVYTDTIRENLKYENTKIAKKVFDFLDKDTLDVVVYHNSFWFEHHMQGIYPFPKYVKQYLIKYMNKHGFSYAM